MYETSEVNKIRFVHFDEQVILKLKRINESLERPKLRDINKIFKRWLTEPEKKFLYKQPIEKVPLFINDQHLGYLVRWRLSIIK